MIAVLALGALLTLAGAVLLVNLFGASDYVIGRVTSRSLGDLAPGFAASKTGFRTYATLVIAIGLVCIGLGTEAWSGPLAAVLVIAGVTIFVIASVIAIAGEASTYRGLKR